MAVIVVPLKEYVCVTALVDVYRPFPDTLKNGEANLIVTAPGIMDYAVVLL